MNRLASNPSGRLGRLAALALALFACALLAVPVMALAVGDDPTVDVTDSQGGGTGSADGDSTETDGTGTEGDGDAVSGDEGSTDQGTVADGIVTLKLKAGTKDYARAKSVADAINAFNATIVDVPVEEDPDADAPAEDAPEGEDPEGEAPEEQAPVKRPDILIDRDLQDAAMQRAAETSIWLSSKRPSGEPKTGAAATALEFRSNGRDVEPAAVAQAVQASGALNATAYRSIGVGCWQQGDERFYVVLLGQGAPTSQDARTTGTESWSPEVRVDLSGATSPVLQGRLQANGYKTNLSMIPASTRSVWFTWVSAPEQSQVATASNLPVIAIDPTTFTWSSSDESSATVSPQGVITMLGTSKLSPFPGTEAGSDITVTLPGTDRSLEFHVSAAVPVYRLLNPETNAHLYTTDPHEYDVLPSYGWKQEGDAWQSVWSSAVDGELTGTPVYRLLNTENGDHLYTSDANEYRVLPNHGWKQEGIAYFSADGLDGQPVYRVFNSYMTANSALGAHHWTTEENERNYLTTHGWNDEGTAFFGVQ